MHRPHRYGLLRVLQHLLPRCDKAVLLAATKSHWHALHTACRARQAACAVEVLRRAMQLGLIGREDCSSATAEVSASMSCSKDRWRDTALARARLLRVGELDLEVGSWFALA